MVEVSDYYRQLFVAAYDAYMGTDQYGGVFGDDPNVPYGSGSTTPRPIESLCDAERGRFGYSTPVTLASVTAAQSKTKDPTDWEALARRLAAAVNDLVQYHPEDDREEWFESFEKNLTPAMVAILGPNDDDANCQSGSRDLHALAETAKRGEMSEANDDHCAAPDKAQ